ncbi:MAG: periplasmic heavy metal sensor, partial [Desulfovibrionaceae bacterium]|nr:periplasmic heavy metal sensor [Desulfovibrionaceae bacterium]
GPCGQFHQGPMGHGPCSEQGPALKTLTPEQRAKYYAIKQEFAPKFQNLRDQLFVKKNVLKALTNSSQTDLGKVEALSQEIVKLQAAKRELHKAMADRLEKECGLKKPMPPIPGVDFLPSGPHHGPFHGPHHGPHHGPMF